MANDSRQTLGTRCTWRKSGQAGQTENLNMRQEAMKPVRQDQGLQGRLHPADLGWAFTISVDIFKW